MFSLYLSFLQPRRFLLLPLPLLLIFFSGCIRGYPLHLLSVATVATVATAAATTVGAVIAAPIDALFF